MQRTSFAFLKTASQRSSIRSSSIILQLILLLSPHLVAQTKQAASRPAATFDGSISLADKLVRDGNFAQALIAAQRAIHLRPSDYRGYYYASFSLLKRQLLDEAQSFEEQGREKAPPDKQPDFDRLAKSIANSRESLAAIHAADRAVVDGSFQIAADSYSKAYEASPAEEQVGLKAAQIYLVRLNQPQLARTLLQELLLRTNDQAVYKQATDLLSKADEAAKQMEAQQQAQAQRVAVAKRATEIASEVDDLRTKRSNLADDLDQIDSDISTAQEMAEHDDENAQNLEDSATGAFGAVAEHGAQQARAEAEKQRREVRRLKNKKAEIQTEIRSIDSQIQSLERVR
jgi:tetratricopeptide (TPR) repeat protein